jgi:hypothetical protein
MEITKREYVGLKVSEAMLAQLGINGAVNGRDYDCMCRDDEECIFCTDDSDYESFLDLELGEDDV